MDKKESQKLLSSIIGYYKSNYSLAVSGSNNIKLNSRTYTARQFTSYFLKNKDSIAESIGTLEFYSLVDHVKKSKKLTKNEDALESIADRVFLVIQEALSKAEKKKTVNHDETGRLKNGFDWSGYIPVIDIKSDLSFMYDTHSKRINRLVTYEAWKKYQYTRDPKKRATAMEETVAANINYDPFNPVDIQYKDIGEQKDVLHLNAHNFPKWRKTKIENPELPKMFVELMEHLFPGEECRNYVYHWLNFLMTSRNHCYLFLHGEQGIGKNTLAYLAEALVGVENSSKVAPKVFEDSRFNDYMHYKRLVFLDEVIIDDRNVTTIRSMTNDTIMIEGKNMKAVYCKNHASFIIANNTDKKNLVTYDDRRYSVPTLTTTPIKHSLGQEWLDSFYTALENEEFIGNIGHWILQNGDAGEYNEKQPYITNVFYDMVDKALHQWQLNLVQLVESRKWDEIELNVLKEEVGTTAGRVTMEGFLLNHRDRDGDIYGKLLQKSNGKRFFKVSDKYLPEDDNNTEESFEDEEW